MKRKHFFAIMSMLALTAFGQQTTKNYTVNGLIEGLPDGTHVQLIPISHDKEKPLADVVVKNGSFTFTGTVEGPRAVRLKVKDADGSRYMMLGDGTININGVVQGDSTSGYMRYNLSSLSVTGSALSARYDSLMEVRNQADKLYLDNRRTYKDAPKDVREEVDKKFFKTVDSLYYATIMSQKESFWGPLMMISLTVYMDNKMKGWYEDLSENAKASYYGRKVKEELYPAGLIGDTVKDFTLKDNDGKEVTFKSIRENNKYVLIDFWASWCRPCRREIPNLKKLYSQYSEKGFSIVSISLDKKKSDWLKALDEEQMPWANFLDVTGVTTLYKVKLIPMTYLVNSQGILVGENLRGEELAKKLNELFSTDK